MNLLHWKFHLLAIKISSIWYNQNCDIISSTWIQNLCKLSNAQQIMIIVIKTKDINKVDRWSRDDIELYSKSKNFNFISFAQNLIIFKKESFINELLYIPKNTRLEFYLTYGAFLPNLKGPFWENILEFKNLKFENRLHKHIKIEGVVGTFFKENIDKNLLRVSFQSGKVNKVSIKQLYSLLSYKFNID